MGCNFSDLNGCRIWSCFHKMQLLGILLAANRVHTANFQAFLASDKFPICLVTVFVFVFFNICICVVRQLYYLDILAVHALLGNNTSNHSSSSHIWALQSRILHYRTFVPIKFSYISSYKHYQMAFALAPHSCQNLHSKSCFWMAISIIRFESVMQTRYPAYSHFCLDGRDVFWLLIKYQSPFHPIA